MLKLKTAKFQICTASVSIDAPTQLADRIFRVASAKRLRAKPMETAYRLLGVAPPCAAQDCDPPISSTSGQRQRAAAEHAIDRVREKFGADAVGKGRGDLRNAVVEFE